MAYEYQAGVNLKINDALGSLKKLEREVDKLKRELRSSVAQASKTGAKDVSKNNKKASQSFDNLSNSAKKYNKAASGASSQTNKLNRNIEKTNKNTSKMTELWQRFGKVGLGFTAVYQAVNATVMGLHELSNVYKEGIQQAGELVSTQAKVAMWYSMATDGAISYADAFERARVNTEALADASVRSISSLSELATGLDEVGQAGVNIGEDLMDGFANLIDFTTLVAQTTGSTTRQVRQELQALMQGQMRTTNILIRTAKHLGVITEEQIAGLKRQEGRLEAIRDIIEGIGETWQRAKKQMIISDVNTGFKMWRDTLVRIVSKSEELTSKQEGTLSIFGETAYEHFDRLSEKLDQVTDEELGNFLRVINYGFDKFLTLSENAVYFMGDVGDAIVENKKLADDLIDVFTDAGSLIKDTADESLTALNKALKATLKTLNSLAGLPGAGSSEGIIGTLLVGRMLGKWGRYISYLIVFDKIAGDLNEKLDKHWPFEGDAPYPLKMPTIGDFNDALDEANQGLTNLGQKMQGIRNESGDLTLFGKAMGAGNTDIYQRARAVSELRKRYDSIKDKIEKIRKIDQTKHPEKWQKGLREINKLQDELGVTERRLKLAEKSFDNATESANAFRKTTAPKGGLDTFAKQKESVKKIKAAFDEASIKAEYFFDRLKDKVKAGETPADLTVEYAKQELNNELNRLKSIKNRIEKNLSGYKDKFGKTPLYEEAKRQVAALNVNITDTQKKLKAVETGNFEDLVDLLEKSKKKTKDFNDVIRQYKEQNLDSYTSQLVSSLKSAGGAYEELAEQIVNNNLVWTDQKEILSGLTKEQKENLRTLLKLIRANKESEDLKERKKAIKEFNQEYRKTFMDSYELERREIRKQAQEYKSQGINIIRIAKWRKEELTRIAKEEAKAKLEASRKWEDGAVRGLKNFADEATNTAALTENYMTSAFSSLTDTFAEFCATGKANWGDLVMSMYKDWMKMMVKINVTGPLAKTASSFIGNMFSSGGGGYDGTATFQGYQNAMSSASVAHTGGIVGSSISRTRQVPSSIFDNAPRLHNGLTSDEYPAILQRGEEVVPKNEVNKKTDTPKKVRVEIYNESGQEMQVTESKAQFDAQGTIVKLWLDAYKRNKGGLRNALTG